MDQTNESNAELQPSVKYTYPDGCEVFGAPDFAKWPQTGFAEKSPREVQAQALRDESADLIASQQAGAIAAEAAAKATREAEAAKIAAAASAQPTGIVTADQLAQSPDPLPDTPEA